MEKISKIIIIKLQGGLGNQMFQYAFARILAKRNNAVLKLDISFFDASPNELNFTPRHFELGVFKNDYILATISEIKFFKQNSFYYRIKRKLGFYTSKTYVEPNFNFHQEALAVKPPFYIKGYFQSYKYYEDHMDFIKEIFTFPFESLDEINRALFYKIQSKNTISVHIRRGDYITDKKTQQFHGNCSLEYYSNAIALLASKTEEFTLVFFSDDIQWVKEKFETLPYSKIFIDNNTNMNSWIDMLLMSSCCHNIIANSSFSWWAAWLNKYPSKIIIAPKEWYTDSKINTIDLIPPQWVRL